MTDHVVHRPLHVLCLRIALAAGAIASPPLAVAAEPMVHQIVIQKLAFVPGRLEIRPGDRVEWVNRDLAPHTATATDRAWDSGELSKGQSADMTFPAAGTVAYSCLYHPHMRGEIIVLDE